jgi:hypothetical protein
VILSKCDEAGLEYRYIFISRMSGNTVFGTYFGTSPVFRNLSCDSMDQIEIFLFDGKNKNSAISIKIITFCDRSSRLRAQRYLHRLLTSGDLHRDDRWVRVSVKGKPMTDSPSCKDISAQIVRCAECCGSRNGWTWKSLWRKQSSDWGLRRGRRK